MENSHIGWTDNTFNIAEGCMKVSDGCKNCYAERRDNQYHEGSHWGPNTPRRMMSEKYWQKPLMWQKKAAAAGVKVKVFSSSLCDVFEDHEDLVIPRGRLFVMIENTPNLIWQILTKRPENINRFIPVRWVYDGWPENVWMGTSVENQETADLRIPILLTVPARVRFLSCEPLLGAVDLSEYIGLTDTNCGSDHFEKKGWSYNSWSGGFESETEHDSVYATRSGIHWIIVGGESGPNARPMHPDWLRSLRDQAVGAEIPFFFKQWGEFIVPDEGWESCRVCGCTENNACMPGSCYWAEPDLCSQCIGKETPPGDRVVKYRRVGKQFAGEHLSGVEIKEFPILED